MMEKLCKVVVIFLFISLDLTFSQTILWEKEMKNDPIFHPSIYTKVIEDNSYNYVCTVRDHFYSHLTLAKFNQKGDSVFLKNYYFNYATANFNISLTNEGNYHICNSIYKDTAFQHTYSPVRYPQILITDTNGNLKSEKYNYGIMGTDENYNEESVFECLPGYITLYSVSKNKEIYAAIMRDQLENNGVAYNVVIKKYNSSCSLVWRMGFDTCYYQQGLGYWLSGFLALNDSQFIALVYHYNIKDGTEKKQDFLLKIDTNGKLLWKKKIILPEHGTSTFKIMLCGDGSYFISDNYSSDRLNRFYIKLDPNGDNILIQKSIKSKLEFTINKTIELSDGSFVEAGQIKINNNDYESFVRKLDRNFDVLWEFNTTSGKFGSIDDIIETKDGNLVLSGRTNLLGASFNNLYLLKLKDTTLNIIYPLIIGSNSVCRGDTLAYSTKYDANSKIFWNVENGNLITNYGDTLVKIFWNNVGTGRIFVSKNSIHTDRKDTTSFNINVNELPQKPSIVFKEDTLFSSSASGNQWYKNGELIFGATAHYFMPIDSGIYSVQVSISGCSSEMSDNFSIDALSVEENSILSSLILSPNPVHDFLEITVGSRHAVTDIRIFNVFGEEILKSSDLNNSQFSFPNSQFRIDVSGLPSGVYFVRIGDKVGKFLKIMN